MKYLQKFQILSFYPPPRNGVPSYVIQQQPLLISPLLQATVEPFVGYLPLERAREERLERCLSVLNSLSLYSASPLSLCLYPYLAFGVRMVLVSAVASQSETFSVWDETAVRWCGC